MFLKERNITIELYDHAFHGGGLRIRPHSSQLLYIENNVQERVCISQGRTLGRGRKVTPVSGLGGKWTLEPRFM